MPSKARVSAPKSAFGRRPFHEGAEVFGNLGYFPLPDASCSFLSVCCGPGWPIGGAGWAVDLRITNRGVNGDGALQGIVEEREVHSFRS